MKHSIFLIFLSMLVWAVPSSAQIYKWVDESGRTQFSDKPREVNQDVNTNNRKNITPVDNYSKINTDIFSGNVLRLRNMLERKEFNELNRALSDLDNQFISGGIDEDTYLTAYEAFAIQSEDWSVVFDEWRSSTPDTYQPYIGRAIYFYTLGWMYRGNRFSSLTSDDQMNKLNGYLTKSSRDISMAKTFNRNSFPSYFYSMRIGITLGDAEEVQRQFERALIIKPDSYSARMQYLRSLSSRWSRSLVRQKEYVTKLESEVVQYPTLKSLEGFVYKDAGEMAAIDKKYVDAETLYGESLAIGEHHTTFFKRSIARYKLENYAGALKDIDRAVELNSEKPDYHYWRARILMKFDRYEEAAEALKTAQFLDPYNENIKKRVKILVGKLFEVGYRLRKGNNLDAALDVYNTALQLDSSIADLYVGRAHAQIQRNNISLAISDLRSAIALDPHEIEYYLLIDHLLASKGEWSKIIKYWDDFIALHPESGRAYAERAGAYYHKKDMVSAMNSAKIASDLGDPNGMDIYSNLKEFEK